MNLGKLLARFGRQAEMESPIDVYFVSYPKCGATWIRVLLGKYVQLLIGAGALPLFDGAPYESSMARRVPRIKFTHQPLVWERQQAADLDVENTVAPFERAKVVLIVRYPLDALLSGHAQWQSQLGNSIAEPIAFIADPVFGLEKLLRFHDLWAGHHDRVRGFLPIRYENMLQSAMDGMRQILHFIGIPCDSALLEQAVTFASFDSMRKMQLSPDVPVYPTSGLPIFGPVDPANPESFHVRRGIAGGYRDSLTPAQREPLEAMIAQRMSPIFGYQAPPCAA